MRAKLIFSTERMQSGYICIRGIIGERLYLYYSKREAERRYRAEAKKHRMVCGKIVYYVR